MGRVYVASSPVIGTNTNDTVLEMLVDSGSTGHYLDMLIPRLQNQMKHYQELEETHKDRRCWTSYSARHWHGHDQRHRHR